jgi:fructose-1,6-bisphosphatase/inositol monophosphatase family enzyme
MKSSLIDRVTDVLRSAAAEAVMPRYRALAAGDVEEKSPGELVTVADREAEALIAAGLAGLVPGARFVGEEACASDPSLLDGLGEGAVWIVDPIDGTGNFAAGTPPFAIMAALLREGETLASWILDPLGDRIATAELGSGAWIDGERIRAAPRSFAPSELRGVISRFQIPDSRQAAIAKIEASVREVVATRRCAGHEYPLVATGELDFAIYWRTIVWDHAPGVLLLREAGGCAVRHDGRSYRPTVPGTGMLLAHDPEGAEALLAMLGG